MTMLGNAIVEQCAAPSNSATITLTGAVTGFERFRSQIADGGKAFVVVNTGTGQKQAGYMALTYGASDTLTWAEVIWNSEGTQPSRITFVGSAYVYCAVPAEYMLFKNPDTVAVDFLDADLRGMASVNSGAPWGPRNRVLNPKMEVWQAGSSFNNPASLAMHADAWDLSYDGSGSTFTVSRQDITDATVMARGLKRSLRVDRTVAGSGGTQFQLRTKVEGVHELAGQTVVVGFWAKADSARSVGIYASQVFGTGGSPSSTVNTTVGTVNVTTSWAWYQASVALPSISGKTLGSNGDDRLILVLGLPVNTTMQFEFADVQFMEGTELPAAMAQRCPYAEALRACQRHRCAIPLGMTGAAASTTVVTLAGATPQPMASGTLSVSASGTATVNFPGGAGDKTSTNAPTVTSYDSATGRIVMSWGGFTSLTAAAPAIYTGAPTTALLTAW